MILGELHPKKIEHRRRHQCLNYKVSIEKAENVLSFHPNHDVKAIVKNLIEHMDEFKDGDNPQHYNIDTLKLVSANNALRWLAEVVR